MMKLSQKKRLYALLAGLFIPALYLVIKFFLPAFPIPESTLVTIIVTAVGLFIGGWNGVKILRNK